MTPLTPKPISTKILHTVLIQGIPKGITRKYLLNYLGNTCDVIGLRMLSPSSAEVVLLATSDFLSLYTLPLFIRGQQIQVVPFFNRGMRINHFFEIYDTFIRFEFNPLVIHKETLIGLLQSYSSTQLTLRTKFVAQELFVTSDSLSRENSETARCQLIIENFDELGPDFKIALESFGYGGHFYDFPIAWIDQQNVHKNEALMKVIIKMTRKASKELDAIRSRSLQETGDFFDPYAKNHAKSIYKKLKLVRPRSGVDFYSQQGNKHFFETAAKISNRSKPKNVQKIFAFSSLELPPKVKAESAPNLSDGASFDLLLQGQINLVTCISMEAENRKTKISRLNRKFSSVKSLEQQTISDQNSPVSGLIQIQKAKELLILEMESPVLEEAQKQLVKKRIVQIKKAEYKWKYRERKRKQKQQLYHERQSVETEHVMRLKGGAAGVYSSCNSSSGEIISSSCSIEGGLEKERKGSH